MRNKIYYLYEILVIEQHRKLFPTHDVWHWKDLTDYHLIESGYITTLTNSKSTIDIGFDGLALDKNGNYHGIQAKYYNSRVSGRDLGTFFQKLCLLRTKNQQSIGYLYTKSGITKNLSNDISVLRYPIKHIHYPWIHPITF